MPSGTFSLREKVNEDGTVAFSSDQNTASAGQYFFMHLLHLTERFCEEAAYMKGYTATTLQRYRYTLRLFCALTRTEDTAGVTLDSVRQFFFDGRSRRHWSVTTFLTYRKTLKVFFQWCRQAQYLTENPVDGIEKPRREKRLPPKLTREEADRLLELVDNYPWGSVFVRRRNHAIFATFMMAGLRKKELLNLTFTDVDIEHATVLVRQGKGQKDRIVPLVRRLAEILERYRAERYRLHKTCPEFFTSLTHNAGLTDDGFRHLLARVVKAFGVKFSAHKLRHTFATLMLEGGCDIYSLSQMMGHSDIRTTTLYLSASAAHLRAQVGKHPLNDTI